MPPFRFNIPFFSYGSPSRPSSGTSSPSPPPTPPTSSRPPFRPGGIAQPSKPATSLETKPKVPSSLSRSKSNVAASSSASQLPSRGAATPTRLGKQSNQSGSPVKKPESVREEVAMKDKPSREVGKEAGENINPVAEKRPIAHSEPKQAEEAHEQRKRREVEKLAVQGRNAKAAEEQQKGKETEKLAVEEKKKAIRKDMEENSKTAQEQEKSRVTNKLAVQEKKKVLGKDMGESSNTTQEQHKRKETERLAAEEKNKALSKNMEEDSKTSQEREKIKETEKLAAEETENSKTAQEQQKIKETEKLAAQERQTPLKTVGREDATQSKTMQPITAASESTRGPKEGSSSSMSKKIKEDIRDGLSKLTWGKSNGDNEKSVSVFTLTGENRGANMAIGSEKDKKGGEVYIRRGYKTNPDESPDTTETEGGTRLYPKDNVEEEDARVRAYVNGNSQGVNNSIICDSSVQQNDPGIHMNLKFEKCKKKDGTISSPPENVVEKKPATEKVLKYEPRVRRRCLRGLLAESSQSEPENPLKPRRHGCRFTCKDKDIENT